MPRFSHSTGSAPAQDSHSTAASAQCRLTQAGPPGCRDSDGGGARSESRESRETKKHNVEAKNVLHPPPQSTHQAPTKHPHQAPTTKHPPTTHPAPTTHFPPHATHSPPTTHHHRKDDVDAIIPASPSTVGPTSTFEAGYSNVVLGLIPESAPGIQPSSSASASVSASGTHGHHAGVHVAHVKRRPTRRAAQAARPKWLPK